MGTVRYGLIGLGFALLVVSLSQLSELTRASVLSARARLDDPPTQVVNG